MIRAHVNKDKLLQSFAYSVLIVYLVTPWLFWIPKLNETTTLVNYDRRHAWLAWAQIDNSPGPWSDPVLADPGSSFVRLQLALPHLLLWLIRHLMDPRVTWLIAVTAGTFAMVLAMRWLFRLGGLASGRASIAAILAVVFAEVLGNIPPLTLNQLRYVLDYLTLRLPDRDSLPLFFGPSIWYFSHPYFIVLMCLLITLVRDISKADNLARLRVNPNMRLIGIFFVALCSLIPLVYLYHWVQIATLIGAMGIYLLFSQPHKLLAHIRFLGAVIAPIAVVWLIFLILNSQLVFSESGYDYLLTTGYQETREIEFNIGSLFRLFLLMLAYFAVLRYSLLTNLVVYACLAILFSSHFLSNIQLLVGRTVQPGHFGFLNKWMVIVLLIILVRIISSRMNHQKSTVMQNSAAMVVAAAMVYALVPHMHAWWRVIETSTLSVSDQELISFFRDNPELKVFVVDDVGLESNLIFLLSRRSFLPWGALSTVTPQERVLRAYIAWNLLNSSEIAQSFGKWLSLHSWHLFHMKYGTSFNYSSSLYQNPATRDQVIAFVEDGILPEEEQRQYDHMVQNYQDCNPYRLDAVIIPTAEDHEVSSTAILFQNDQYLVITPSITSCSG